MRVFSISCALTLSGVGAVAVCDATRAVLRLALLAVGTCVIEATLPSGLTKYLAFRIT